MIKEKLAKQEAVIGTWSEIPSPVTANIIAKAGMDFIILDMEHGPVDFKTAQEMAMAAEADGAEVIIRVAKNDESNILRSLDTGAAGILVPHISTVKEREDAVRFAKFAPLGNRSYNPYVRAMGYSVSAKMSLENANEKSVVGIMLEDETSLANLEAIINDPSIDIVYLGIYDLAVSMGFGGDIHNPKVTALVAEAIAKIRARNKAPGCMVHSQEEIQYYKKLGATFLVYKIDTALLYDSYKNIAL